MPYKVASAIGLLKIVQSIVGQPGVVELYITDNDSVLIGRSNDRITLADVIAALSECRDDAEIAYIRYDAHLRAFQIVWHDS